MATIFDTLTTTSPLDTYPTHDSLLGKGGHREVIELSERNAIPDERRRVGMTVYVDETRTTYRLIGGITNDHWTLAAVELSELAVGNTIWIMNEEGEWIES